MLTSEREKKIMFSIFIYYNDYTEHFEVTVFHFYSDPNCVHVQPGTGRLQAQFDIYLNSCGMTSTSSLANYGQPTPTGTYIENTVIIQYDPLVQEVRKGVLWILLFVLYE